MKSKDSQKIVFSKRQNGDGPTKIFRDLSGGALFKNGRKMVQDDRWIRFHQSLQSYRLSTYHSHTGRYSKSQTSTEREEEDFCSETFQRAENLAH